MACTVDFRCLDEGFGGKTYKRKRCLQEEELQQQMELQQQLENGSDAAMDVEFEGVDGGLPSSKRQAIASATDPNKPVGRPTYDGVIAGRVSGRNWKQVRTHRSSAVKVSLRRTTAEQRSKEKEIKKAYQERKKELKEEIRQHKVEKRKKKEEREKRKQANILLSGTKLQKITNPKTLLKMSKSAKDRKLLKNLPVKEEVTPESAKDRLKKMSHPRKLTRMISPFNHPNSESSTTWKGICAASNALRDGFHAVNENIICSPSTKDKYTVKSAYNWQRGTTDNQPPSPWSTIWKLKAPARYNFLLWQINHGSLVVGEFLFSHHTSNSPDCIISNITKETAFHALRNCGWPHHTWRNIVPMNDWNTFFTVPNPRVGSVVIWKRHQIGRICFETFDAALEE